MKEAFRLKELGILPGRFKIVGETKNHIIVECDGRFVIDKSLFFTKKEKLCHS